MHKGARAFASFHGLEGSSRRKNEEGRDGHRGDGGGVHPFLNYELTLQSENF